MSIPTITQSIDGYDFLWAEGVNINVSRLRVHTDGRVTGEIIVKNQKATLYPQTQFNFSSDRTRSTLINSLNKLYPKHEWQGIVDQLSYHINNRAREGEPVLELTTNGEIQPPEYCLEPLIIKNYPNIIFGDPGSSKSTLAVILAQVVMLPWYDNPMGLKAPDKTHHVLYLDWETDADTIRWQTTMLQRGIADTDILFLNYRHCSQPLAQDIEQIKRHIHETQTDIIIIDSLGLASGGELKETQTALDFYSALRGLKTTSLILAHNSKDRESKTRSIYGNQFFTAQARNVWEIRKSQDDNSSEMDIGLFHRKPPPFAGLHKPLGFKITFNSSDNSMNVTKSDPKNTEEFIELLKWKDRIVIALKGRPMTNKELCDELKTTSANISVNLRRLEKQEVVSKEDDKWGLIERKYSY
jgi:hypothetical protein